MKISQEANEKNLKEITEMQERWQEVVTSNDDLKDDQVEITVLCKKRDNFTRGSGVAGIPFSQGWWKIFEYWLTVRLAAEGLLVLDVKVSEGGTES